MHSVLLLVHVFGGVLHLSCVRFFSLFCLFCYSLTCREIINSNQFTHPTFNEWSAYANRSSSNENDFPLNHAPLQQQQQQQKLRNICRNGLKHTQTNDKLARKKKPFDLLFIWFDMFVLNLNVELIIGELADRHRFNHRDWKLMYMENRYIEYWNMCAKTRSQTANQSIAPSDHIKYYCRHSIIHLDDCDDHIVSLASLQIIKLLIKSKHTITNRELCFTIDLCAKAMIIPSITTIKIHSRQNADWFAIQSYRVVSNW